MRIGILSRTYDGQNLLLNVVDHLFPTIETPGDGVGPELGNLISDLENGSLTEQLAPLEIWPFP